MRIERERGGRGAVGDDGGECRTGNSVGRSGPGHANKLATCFLLAAIVDVL